MKFTKKHQAAIADDNGFDTTTSTLEVVATKAVEAPSKEQGEFPADLRECFPLLTALDNVDRWPSRVAQAEHCRRLALLKKHVADLQQGPVAPLHDADTQASERNAWKADAAHRKARLAQLLSK